jgi:DNA-binding NarL/FixJ family response regulator
VIRVLICDDHVVVRQGLKQILADAPDIEVCGEAGNGADAIQLARTCSFDLMLLDIALPQRDGLDVLKQVRRELPRLAVLMLSTYPDKQYAVRCIRLGAAGYVNKSTDADELLEAIRKAASGRTYLTLAQAEALAASVAGHGAATALDALSHREYQVFQLIAQGHGIAAIAARLSLSPNPVSTYRARICEKTGARNDVEIALYALGQTGQGRQAGV